MICPNVNVPLHYDNWKNSFNQMRPRIGLRQKQKKFRLGCIGETHFWDGGDKGSRTPDLLNAIETLYQLSYIPKG